MVSCTRVEGTLQAYIDGELGDSDRAIFEQHVAECESCRDSLRTQQRANATLFAVFADDRLDAPLRYRVLAHLPMMEVMPRDSDSVVDLINERAKNPRTTWVLVGRLMPAAAIAILVFVTLVLYNYSETHDLGNVTSIGMVTNAFGDALLVPGDGPMSQPAELQKLITRGDRLETRRGSFLMVSLTGPTSVKIGSSTSLRVTDARNISLERGKIWLDVGRDGKLFRVNTPRGEVTVFGTCFSVSYVNELTTVTVERGEVQVETDQEFCALEAGQRAEVSGDGALSEPSAVDAKIENAWARVITPDPLAESAFNSRVQVTSPAAEMPSRSVYVVDTFGGTVSSLRIYWQPSAEAEPADFRSYDLYVLGENGEPIVHRRLQSSKFAAPGASSLDIPLDTPISGMKSIEIRLVPDYLTGSTELKDVEVKADVLMKTGS
ncbi:MAG: FecR domain-containing protein [Candidatus Hydrogenedentes bacterium]|nr:FecR domain-containing protein [Candidatus Hydrogenedentota bacterium]